MTDFGEHGLGPYAAGRCSNERCNSSPHWAPLLRRVPGSELLAVVAVRWGRRFVSAGLADYVPAELPDKASSQASPLQ